MSIELRAQTNRSEPDSENARRTAVTKDMIRLSFWLSNEGATECSVQDDDGRRAAEATKASGEACEASGRGGNEWAGSRAM